MHGSKTDLRLKRFDWMVDMARKIKKQKTDSGFVLEQRYLTKTNRLELDKGLCLGCWICNVVCPKEAITLSDASLEDGRLVRKPEVDIDPEKCILCGACVIFCPSNAIKATTDGEEYIPVVEYEAMPTLTKTIKIDYEKCDIDCGLKCREACPVEAIIVETQTEEGATRITNVDVDERLCFYCKQCETACPFNLIKVERPFWGRVEIDIERCPDNCMACVDACPDDALRLDDGGRPEVNQEFCILCSVCEKVCPEDAIHVYRTSIECSDVKSGAWFTALEKLTSTEVLARELGKKADKSRREVVKERVF